MASVTYNLKQTVRRKDNFTSFSVDDSLVFVDRERSLCYSLNATGARVWDLIAEPVAVDMLCQSICQEFSVDRETCERDVVELLDGLRQAELLS
jgi:hypothetical protein